MTCPGCPPPPHEHGEGMNECPICDAQVPCADCGHPHLHTKFGCWGLTDAKGEMACLCKTYRRPSCSDCRPATKPGEGV